MNDKVTKALECCAETGVGYCPGRCDGCPYDAEGDACIMAMSRDALELIRRQEAQVPRWIPVEERLPEPDTVVIAFFDDGEISTVHQSWSLEGSEALIYKGFYTDDHDQAVTHWMPLPEPPEEV